MPAPPAGTSLEGGRRGDGARLSPPPTPSATTATVTKWQLGARLASHRHRAGDGRPSPRGWLGTWGEVSHRPRHANGEGRERPADPSRSRGPGTPRPLLTGAPGLRLRPSAAPVCAQVPTARSLGARRSGSAAAVGEGRVAGAPGNMAARPSSAPSLPPVLKTRLGREVAGGGSPSSPPLDHLFHSDASRGS